MSSNKNQFQSRLDAILKAKVALHFNGDWLEIQVESNDNQLTSGALKYTQYDNVFNEEEASYSFVGVSEDGAIVNGFIHDGSDKNGRGYGGQSFELTMQDGSHKVITGPWSGRPSVHTVNSGIQYTEIRVNDTLYGFSKEFIEAIVDRFNLNVSLDLVSRNKEIEIVVKVPTENGGK
jgi:hypothetical protein